MLLKKVCTEFAIFESDDPNKDFEDILRENCEKYPDGPCNDVPGEQQPEPEEGAKKKKKKRDQGNNVRDLITAFAICNNVTPVFSDPNIDRALEVFDGDNRGRGTYNENQRSMLIEGNDPLG